MYDHPSRLLTCDLQRRVPGDHLADGVLGDAPVGAFVGELLRLQHLKEEQRPRRQLHVTPVVQPEGGAEGRGAGA